ncbi:MAG: isoprenylcysteine carboxylmethyltransferase family protein, partial [Ginsengibacter sp.]
MIAIGNFFFKYRNFLFIFLYLLLFIPSPLIFSKIFFHSTYWIWPVAIGLIVTFAGQIIRGLTIGLIYIIRGGKNRNIYAEDLVTQGIFSHCRNPLYLGNILMLLGVGILSDSAIYVFIVMPVFIFIYHAIVLAEENFLRKKFGDAFSKYCSLVNRWLPDLRGLIHTLRGFTFNWRRWLLKEYNTQFVWLSGIVFILLFKYPKVTSGNKDVRNWIL